MDKNIDHGGYVYAQQARSGTQYDVNSPGLTRRDWLAGLAMQALSANVGWTGDIEQTQEDAYKMADANIAEGKRGKRGRGRNA